MLCSKHVKPTQTVIPMHPGWCKTDMGGENAPLPSLEGATHIYNLVEGEYKSGAFYSMGKESDYYKCE